MTVGRLRYLLPVLAAAAFVGGPALVHLGAVNPLVGLQLTAVSALLGLGSTLYGLRLAFKGASRQGVICVLVGVVPLAFIGNGILGGRKVPRLNDVSTDLDNPPPLAAAKAAADNAGQDLAYPAEFKDLVRSGYSDLISKAVDLPPAEAFAHAQAVAKKMPKWQIVATDPAALTIEGFEVSSIYRFVDDFVIRIEPLDGRSIVAMRSRSRLGQGDFGVNAQRIRAFFAALERAP